MINRIMRYSAIIISYGIFSSLLLCMHNVDDVNSKIIQQRILEYSSKFADHQLICALAITNKGFQEAVKQNAHVRKSRIEDFIKNRAGDKFGTLSERVWHSNQSACTMLGSVSLPNKYGQATKKSCLCYVSLSDNDINCTYQECSEKTIEKMRLPFFLSNGDVCFYGVYFDETSTIGHLNEYIISCRGKSETAECMAIIPGTKKPIRERLFYLLGFPMLVSNFLNSTVVGKENNVKTFSLQGVMLSSDFREHGDSNPFYLYKSFTSLPKNIKEPIIAHYQVQSTTACLKEQKKVQ